MEALQRLHQTVLRAHKVNPHLRFEVFIHKVDGLSDDTKIETQRDIHQRANDDLIDAGYWAVKVFFFSFDTLWCLLVFSLLCVIMMINLLLLLVIL